MATTCPEITGGVGHDLEPLAVSPRQACHLLAVGNTRLYALLAAHELESYHDGRSRRITTASIRSYIARRLAAAGATDIAAQVPTPRKRGRPRKTQATQAAT